MPAARYALLQNCPHGRPRSLRSAVTRTARTVAAGRRRRATQAAQQCSCRTTRTVPIRYSRCREERRWWRSFRPLPCCAMKQLVCRSLGRWQQVTSARARTAGAARTAARNHNHRHRHLIRASASTVALASAPTGTAGVLAGTAATTATYMIYATAFRAAGMALASTERARARRGTRGAIARRPHHRHHHRRQHHSNAARCLGSVPAPPLVQDSTNNPATTTFLARVLRLKLRFLRRCEHFI